MGGHVHVVLIETSGNQRYIFATNKLKENVGASELVHSVGTKFVFEALGQLHCPSLGNPDDTANPGRNPPVEQSGKPEVVIAASGKALILVDSAQQGEELVRAVTESALRCAPGVEVYGAVSGPFDIGSAESVHNAVGEATKEHARLRGCLPGPASRFLRLPIVAECATSGLPAACYDSAGPEPGPRSAVTLAKRKATDAGIERMCSLAEEDIALSRTVDEMDKRFGELEWIAVVHADGNGVGQIFLDFATRSRAGTGRDYVDKLRSFSLALDRCTASALKCALRRMGERMRRQRERPDRAAAQELLPVVPLVVGGDDLTVVCDGRYALEFAADFLRAFEDVAGNDDSVSEIAKGPLSGCAGVAIVKPHYPFFAAYSLAEDLTNSAKAVKQNAPGCSALDYHILYDASGADLERIRQHLRPAAKTRLYARPYVVTKGASGSWAEIRRWDDLTERVGLLVAKENGRRKLPNSMLHDLREALFLGPTRADARLSLVYERYKDQGLRAALRDRQSLFVQDANGDQVALLMDAMDVVEFIEHQGGDG